MIPRETILAFDDFLAEHSLRLEAVVIGGAALGLLGVTTRQTQDCDILHPDLPELILAAARRFATERRAAGGNLQDDWLNNGPSQLTDVLPQGWEQRLQAAFTGAATDLQTLGRADLLKTKLFALCDRGTDLSDCLALTPTADELSAALPWLAEQDTNELWPEHVEATLADLAERLGHGL